MPSCFRKSSMLEPMWFFRFLRFLLIVLTLSGACVPAPSHPPASWLDFSRLLAFFRHPAPYIVLLYRTMYNPAGRADILSFPSKSPLPAMPVPRTDRLADSPG